MKLSTIKKQSKVFTGNSGLPISILIFKINLVAHFFSSGFCRTARGQKIDSLILLEYIPRINCNQRLEPDGVLIGAGQVMTSFTYNFRKAVKRNPAFHMDYAGLKSFKPGSAWSDSLVKRISQFPWKCALQLGLSMTSDGTPELHYEDKVAKGEYDVHIKNFISVLKRINCPVYLRIGYEFNGEWNGYVADSYREAYIRIYRMLREANCDNVVAIWCFSPDGKNHNFMKYYPGDAFVDWWAIDLFGQQHFSHPATLAFADSSLAHKKPLMIGESTARKTDMNDSKTALKRWFVPYFNFIRNRPNVKALSYINQDWAPTFLPDWGDARIEKNRKIEKWVKRELANSFYLGASE